MLADISKPQVLDIMSPLCISTLFCSLPLQPRILPALILQIQTPYHTQTFHSENDFMQRKCGHQEKKTNLLKPHCSSQTGNCCRHPWNPSRRHPAYECNKRFLTSSSLTLQITFFFFPLQTDIIFFLREITLTKRLPGTRLRIRKKLSSGLKPNIWRRLLVSLQHLILHVIWKSS